MQITELNVKHEALRIYDVSIGDTVILFNGCIHTVLSIVVKPDGQGVEMMSLLLTLVRCTLCRWCLCDTGDVAFWNVVEVLHADHR